MSLDKDEVIHMLATAASESDDIVFDDDDDDPDTELRPEPSLIIIKQEEAPSFERSQLTSQPPNGAEASQQNVGSFEEIDVEKQSRQHAAAASQGVSAGSAHASEKEGTSTPLPIRSTPSVSFKDSPDIQSQPPQTPQSPPGVSTSPSDLTNHPPDSPKSHSVLTIEHTVESRSRSPALLLGMSKPVFAAVAFVVLLTTISSGYFLSQFIRIPGLNNQIKNLESQVTRLEEQIVELQQEINRLTQEVDRLGSEVDRLEVANEDLAQNNDRLEKANEDFSSLNADLNASNAALEMQLQNLTNITLSLANDVTTLTNENERLENSISTLPNRTLELEEQVYALQNATTQLNATNQDLRVEVDELTNETAMLTEISSDLQDTNDDLASEVNRLGEENANLQRQVERLESILLFLNETLSDGGTFGQIVEELNDMIDTNRNLVLETQQNQYKSTVDAWLCDFQMDFAGLPFIIDTTIPIGSENYPAVIENVDLGALVPLCLDRTNFEAFMSSNIFGQTSSPPPPSDVTAIELSNSVTRYTLEAINYYFPDEQEDGMTPEDWARAGYDCSGVPADLRFLWMASSF